MRHGKKVNHLGRTSSHRKAMLSNMATSLIMSKRISTTVAKAKALRKYIEPLITKAKQDETHSRREVFSHLQNKFAVTELFREISAKVGDRPGGYTRILRTGFRLGDAAEMCIIELVDFNENYSQNKGGKRAKAKTRRGRGGVKKIDTPKVEQEEVQEVTEVAEVTEIAEAVAETAVEEVEPQVEEVVAEIIGEQTEEAAEVAEVTELPLDEVLLIQQELLQ
jgi:large subunit ribosomal protein L17